MLADGVIRICFREEGFRTRLFEPFRSLFLGLLVLGEVFAVSQGPNSLLTFWLWVPGTVGIYSLAAVFVLTRWISYVVGPEGVAGYDFWGRSRISWEDVSRMRVVRILGMEYLLISGHSRRNVWVLLCVDRYDLLRRLLLTYADPRHALDDVLPSA